jgi:hypothetical protein
LTSSISLICSKFEIMGCFLSINCNTDAIQQTKSIIDLSSIISLICSNFIRMRSFLEIKSDSFPRPCESTGNVRREQFRRSIRRRLSQPVHIHLRR